MSNFMRGNCFKVTMIKHITFLLLSAGILLGSVMSEKANAETKITLIADKAKIVKVAGKVASVIVGNPAFADVSVQNGFIIVHGRNFGQTNILVLDENGDVLADMSVTIIRGPNRNVSVYRAGLKASYACAPTCESTLQVGDSPAYFKVVQESIVRKMGLAAKAGKLTTK